MGKNFEKKCYIPWCTNIINVFDFHVGHDVPESHGGALDINNLKYTPRLTASTSQTLLYLTSNTPIKSIDTSKIFLYADSQIVKIDNYTITGTTSILYTNTKINTFRIFSIF